MERTPVLSSNLRAVGYDPGTRSLEIEFRMGRLYLYSNVPETVYHGLMEAPSKGRYHHRYILGRYRYQRIW